MNDLSAPRAQQPFTLIRHFWENISPGTRNFFRLAQIGGGSARFQRSQRARLDDSSDLPYNTDRGLTVHCTLNPELLLRPAASGSVFVLFLVKLFSQPEF